MAGPAYLGGIGDVDTGIDLQPGSPATVTATGLIANFWTPEGFSPVDPRFAAYNPADFVNACPNCYGRPAAFAYSLVATVGAGQPFTVGSGPTIIDGSGRLKLAFSDDYYQDNGDLGAFTVTITFNTDSDGDGVPDADDLCAGSSAGAVVNSSGCSLAQLCPCDSPWKNHGAYVSCVARTSETFVAGGLMTAEEKGATVSAAARSVCGAKK